MEGFCSLRVCFSSAAGNSSTHTVYCKLHSVRQSSETTPNGQTLFTLGWPSYCTTQAIQELFSRSGHVIAVYLQSSPGPVDEDNVQVADGFQVGYIVMSSPAEASLALELGNSGVSIPCQTGRVGLSKWACQYQEIRKKEAELERSVEDVMREYDRRTEEHRETLRKGAGQPDEDGWITVTRKRKRTQQPPTEDDPVKQKKKRQLLNLYPWQQRENQREQLAELRKKFEEDKKRVLEMKSKRKFKPF